MATNTKGPWISHGDYDSCAILQGVAEALERVTPEPDGILPAHSFQAECARLRGQRWEEDEEIVCKKRQLLITDSRHWNLELIFKLDKLKEHFLNLEVPIERLQQGTKHLDSMFLELGLPQHTIDEMRWAICNEEYWEPEVKVWEDLMASRQVRNRKLREARQAQPGLQAPRQTRTRSGVQAIHRRNGQDLSGKSPGPISVPRQKRSRTKKSTARREVPYNLRSHTKTSTGYERMVHL